MNESNNNQIEYVVEHYNKNECGKFIFDLRDTNTKDIKKFNEEQLCKLAVEGKIDKFMNLKDGCVSQALLVIMLIKDEVYSVIGKIKKDFEEGIAAYEFEDTNKNRYILRNSDTLMLVHYFGEKVKNARLNPNKKYLLSKNGEDLRKIPEKIVNIELYLNKEEQNIYYEQCKSMRDWGL